MPASFLLLSQVDPRGQLSTVGLKGLHGHLTPGNLLNEQLFESMLFLPSLCGLIPCQPRCI